MINLFSPQILPDVSLNWRELECAPKQSAPPFPPFRSDAPETPQTNGCLTVTKSTKIDVKMSGEYRYGPIKVDFEVKEEGGFTAMGKNKVKTLFVSRFGKVAVFGD